MELLAASYASSSSEEDTEPRAGDSTPTPPLLPHPDLENDVVAPAMDDGKQPHTCTDADAVRAAIARRFAARAATATHRATTEERKFTYKPYEPKRRPRGTPNVKQLNAQPDSPSDPLFPTLLASSRTQRNDSGYKTTSTASLPRVQNSVRLAGHTGAVYGLDWNPRYPPLFLSASMDHSVRVWSLPRIYYEDQCATSERKHSLDEPGSEQLCRRVLSHHTQGVKSAKWALDGQHIWSGSFDGRAAHVDVETASVLQQYQHNTNEHATSVCIHPEDPQLALFGTDRGRIVLRDLRMETNAVAATYGTKTTGEVHDLMFLPTTGGGDLRFVSSSALTARDTSHQTLLVWDFRSSAMVSDHLNNDLCAFTRLRLHPNNKAFVAQSTESEVVWFSAAAPYKRLKPKRSFVSGHEVEGFSVGCSFNVTGSLFATGDINGRVVFYCARTQRLLRQSQVYSPTTPSLSVEFHPRWPSTLICGGNDGKIMLLDPSSPIPLE